MTPHRVADVFRSELAELVIALGQAATAWFHQSSEAARQSVLRTWDSVYGLWWEADGPKVAVLSGDDFIAAGGDHCPRILPLLLRDKAQAAGIRAALAEGRPVTLGEA